jgi:hypothetical protein
LNFCSFQQSRADKKGSLPLLSEIVHRENGHKGK